MFYHASNIKDLKVLKPHVSTHGNSWVYFSTKRENVLVYLSNAVERHIQQKHGRKLMKYEKWASYGITSDGRVRIEEYYPNATRETFEGVKGYIYAVESLAEAKPLRGIKDVFVSSEEAMVDSCEFIEDAYAEMLKAEEEGRIVIERYQEITKEKRKWIEETTTREYQNSDNDDYKEFLIDKFDWLKGKVC